MVRAEIQETDHWHLSGLPQVFVIAQALGHYRVKGEASPQQDTHLSVLPECSAWPAMNS